MIVVPYRPRQKLFYGAVCVLLVLLAWLFGFFMGKRHSIAECGQLAQELTQMTSQINYLQKQERDLQGQLVKARLAVGVDAQVVEQLRQDISKLNLRLADKEEENAFYKGMMSPKALEKGLAIRSIEISLLPRGQYELRFVVQHIAKQHRLLKGRVDIELSGLQAGNVTTYQLKELSKQSATKLRFKYFQIFSMPLTLPEGFHPESIKVVAKARLGKKNLIAEKDSIWSQAEVQ